MLKSNFAEKAKTRVVRMQGWPIEGVPVKRQVGMIYWYSWGKHTFDIRVMRRVLGLPEESPADKWFIAKYPDQCGSFNEVMTELQKALGERSFHEAMVMHDRAIQKRWESQMESIRLSKADKPTTTEQSYLDGFPF